MKKVLLSFLLLSYWALHQVNAQPCSLANFQISSVYTAADGKCYANVSFDVDRNGGNKFIYLHFWTQANYANVNKARFQKGAGPTYADINGTVTKPFPSLATVAIDNNNYTAPVWSSLNYRPDASVTTVKGSGIFVSSSPVSGSGPNAMYRYSVNAIPLGALGGGCSAANIGAILWSTQANSNISHIHCSAVTPTTMFPLTVTGSAKCATAKYTISLTNNTSSPVSGNIDIYADNGVSPNNGVFDPGTDIMFDSVTNFLINPNSTINITRSIPAKYLGYNLWSQVELSSNSTQVNKMLTSNCSTLPVVLQSFTAIRENQNVVVKWQTATEQDVRGFNILRMTDEGEWKTLAYVPSKSGGAFTSQASYYQYTDLNTFKGISQYRIEEIAVDGKIGWSDVKLIRGQEQSVKLVLYPNPSQDGKVNLVFDRNGVRDIAITDVSGRIVKQIKSVTSTNLLIDNLQAGFYNVQVIDRNTNEMITEKLIVKMR